MTEMIECCSGISDGQAALCTCGLSWACRLCEEYDHRSCSSKQHSYPQGHKTQLTVLGLYVRPSTHTCSSIHQLSHSSIHHLNLKKGTRQSLLTASVNNFHSKISRRVASWKLDSQSFTYRVGGNILSFGTFLAFSLKDVSPFTDGWGYFGGLCDRWTHASDSGTHTLSSSGRKICWLLQWSIWHTAHSHFRGVYHDACLSLLTMMS